MCGLRGVRCEVTDILFKSQFDTTVGLTNARQDASMAFQLEDTTAYICVGIACSRFQYIIVLSVSNAILILVFLITLVILRIVEL